MGPDKHQESSRIGYLIKCYPRLSETFILHEILELEHQGLPLHIFSLLTPTGKINAAAQEVQSTITYFPGGFPRGILLLLAALFRRLRKSPWRALRVGIAALIRFHHPSTPRHFLYAAFLANQLEREGITHLHAHYANTPATVALLTHRLTGIPFSFTAHAKDIYLSRRPTLAYKIKQACFVVTCTDYNRHYLAELADPHTDIRIHRIYHGLDLRAFPAFPADASDPSGPPARPLILSVARLVEKKGLLYLLQACRSLKDQGYDFRCRIVGEGPLRPMLEQQIHDLALTGHVDLWGAETHERVIEMYRQARLVVLPCVVGENGDRDGIPNSLVESLYMGAPVVSTPVSGIPELIKSEVNGLLVPPHDSSALAAAIVRLLADPHLGQRLAEVGRQTVLAQFDMASNTQQLMRLFLGQAYAASPVDEDATLVMLPANLGDIRQPEVVTRW